MHKIFRIISIFIFLISCIKVYAEDFTYFPIELSLTNSISFPSPAKQVNTSLSLGIFDTEYNDLYGIGFSFLSQESFGTIYGGQLSFANFAHNIQYGGQLGLYNRFSVSNRFALQLGLINVFENANFAAQLGLVNWGDNYIGGQLGFVNFSDNGDGAQVGLVNINQKMNGAQLGLVNKVEDITGTQLGFVNVADSIQGVQFGLVNYANNEEGTSIGLISFIKNGTFRISTNYSTQNEPSIQTEFGGKKIYNVIRYNYNGQQNRFEYWIGFGSNVNLYANKFYFYPQIYMNGPNSVQNGYGLTAKFGYFISDHSIEIIAGNNFTYNEDTESKKLSFSSNDEFNFSFFCGIQFDLRKSVFQFISDYLI